MQPSEQIAVLLRTENISQRESEESVKVAEESREISSFPLAIKIEEITISYRHITQKLCAIGLPLSFIGILRTGESLLIAKFLKDYGSNALAVDGLLSLYMTFLMNANSTLVNNIPTNMIANAFGRGSKLEIGKIVQQNWILAGVLSIPVMGLLCAAEPMLNLLGQPRELTGTVGKYAWAISPAVPALLTNLVDINFLKSISRQLDLIPYQIFSVSLGVGASYVFILGKLGAPPSGAVGIGYALTIQAWITGLAAKLYFYHKKDFKAYELFNFSHQNWGLIKSMLHFGTPLWALSLVDNGSNFTVGLYIGWLGTNRIAINQALSLQLKLFNMLTDGIKQANQICVSQHNGRQIGRHLAKFSWAGISLVGGINIIPIALFAVIPPHALANLFVSDEIIADFESMLRLYFISKAISNFFDAIKGSFSDNLNYLYDTFFPTLVQILMALVISLPFSYVMAFTCDFNYYGLNFALATGLAANLPILMKRLQSRMMLMDNPQDIETREIEAEQAPEPVSPGAHRVTVEVEDQLWQPEQAIQNPNPAISEYASLQLEQTEVPHSDLSEPAEADRHSPSEYPSSALQLASVPDKEVNKTLLYRYNSLSDAAEKHAAVLQKPVTSDLDESSPKKTKIIRRDS